MVTNNKSKSSRKEVDYVSRDTRINSMDWQKKWPEWASKTGSVKANTPPNVKQEIYDYRLVKTNSGVTRLEPYGGKDNPINHLCSCGKKWTIPPSRALKGKVCVKCSKKNFSIKRPRKLKPAGYWTFKRCREKALKCTTKTEFRKNYRSAFNAANRNNWLEKLTSHMIKSTVFFTKELCAIAAAECSTLKEFQAKFSSEYNAACRNQWLDEITKHMGIKAAKYWTYERCKEKALQCKTRNELHEKYLSVVWFAKKNGWFDEITGHMLQGNVIWTEQKCAEVAQLCKSRSELKEKYIGAYGAALKYNIMDQICLHMSIEHNGFHHCAYAIVNEGAKIAYIGVTVQSFDERMGQHKRESNKCNSRELTKLEGTVYIQLTGYIFTAEDVSNFAEQQYVNEYIANGYFVVNDPVTIGRVGTTNARRWTYEKCKEKALLCSTRTEFTKKYSGAFKAAKNNGWYEDLVSHMEEKPEYKPEEWRYINCKQKALECNSKSEFSIRFGAAYQYALKYGWLDDITAHMTQKKKPNGYYTKAICLELSRKCNTRNEFQRQHSAAYSVSKDRGWFDECVDHMKTLFKGGWLHPNANLNVWASADEIFELWINNGNCGFKKLGRIYGVEINTLQSMVEHFKKGWIPNNSPDWFEWANDRK